MATLQFPPRTPIKRTSPIPSGSAPRSTTGSPAITRGAASPQVRAAIAAMRKQRATASEASSLGSSEVDGALSEDPFASGGRGKGHGAGDTLGDEWGLKSVGSLVEGARRTGRLNIASRSLPSLPPSIYSTLMPISSSYHPSNRAPPSSAITNVDLTISTATREESDAGAAAWYEQVDLRTLNAANNEIAVIEEEIAGFDELEVLDLRNNYLAALPVSMGYLNNLTSLNLASNRLSTFPLQILALRHLRDVDLSSNALTSLWSPKWRVELEELMKPADASPSASPESKLSPQHPGFWASFPSVQKQAALVDGAEEMLLKSMAPLNALTTLVLADNAFDDQAFTAPGFELPPRLISLDLSSCGLTDVSLPISVLSTLPRLVRLNLSSNVLSDSFPLSPSPSSPLFPALKSIDLSNNAFDSLLNLESTLEGTGKKIDWIGLPKVISNLVRAASVIRLQSGEKERRETVECKVGENLLREEQGRRRGLFPPNPSTPQPVRVVEARVTTMVDVPAAVEVMVQEEAGGEKEAWELEAASGLLTEGGRRRARAEAARRARETPTATPVRTVVEVMESLKLEDGEDSTPPSPSPTARLPPPPYCADKVAEVKLEEQAVEELEVEEEGEDASEEDPAVVLVSSTFDPTTRVLDLSRRKLDAILVPTTGTPPSRLSPSTLNLSHNVFTTLPLSTLSAWSWISLSTLDLSHNSISSLSLLSLPSPLPSLHSLNLSSNALPSTLDSTPLLSSLHTLFPSLLILDLSYNQLSTVEGISSLLFGGIEKLNLRGNQIKTIEELVDVAKTCDGKPVVEGWKCIELDLQDNSIGRLAPTLGLLPELELLVAGNTFRIPRGEVYINGGSKALLAWLRDRV